MNDKFSGRLPIDRSENSFYFLPKRQNLPFDIRSLFIDLFCENTSTHLL